jgi:hypothetical protein
MGRSAARFHAKICSNFAQNGFGVMSVCCRDPIRIGHLKDLLPLTPAPDFTHWGGARVAQHNRNLDTASYATISGSGDSVTFETQRSIPASGKPKPLACCLRLITAASPPVGIQSAIHAPTKRRMRRPRQEPGRTAGSRRGDGRSALHPAAAPRQEPLGHACRRTARRAKRSPPDGGCVLGRIDEYRRSIN